MVETESDIKITTDTPYLALTGEIWGVYCEDFGENRPRYNGTALYIYIYICIKFVADHPAITEEPFIIWATIWNISLWDLNHLKCLHRVHFWSSMKYYPQFLIMASYNVFMVLIGWITNIHNNLEHTKFAFNTHDHDHTISIKSSKALHAQNIWLMSDWWFFDLIWFDLIDDQDFY